MQLEKDRKELELLDKEMGQGKAELKHLHEAIQKRQLQLDNLDRDMDKEINSKRREMKVGIFNLFQATHAINLLDFDHE